MYLFVPIWCCLSIFFFFFFHFYDGIHIMINWASIVNPFDLMGISHVPLFLQGLFLQYSLHFLSQKKKKKKKKKEHRHISLIAK